MSSIDVTGENSLSEDYFSLDQEIERLESKSVRRWLAKLGEKSDNSNIKSLPNRLRQFCKYIEMTPDQLTYGRGKDSKSPDVFIRRRAGRGLTAGFSILRTAGKGRDTCVQRFYAVCSFYERHYLQLKRREEISLNTIG